MTIVVICALRVKGYSIFKVIRVGSVIPKETDLICTMVKYNKDLKILNI